MVYKQIYDCLILGWQIDIVYFSQKNELVFNIDDIDSRMNGQSLIKQMSFYARYKKKKMFLCN